MHNLVIVPKDSQNFGVAHFHTAESAISAQQSVQQNIKSNADSITISDDYGTIIDIPAANISYTAVIDVQKKSEASIDAKLAEARATKGFNEKLMGDKELQLLFRFMQAAQPQPKVIQVAPNGADTPPQPN